MSFNLRSEKMYQETYAGMVKAMECANAIFKSALAAVMPHRLVQKAIAIDHDREELIIAATGERVQLRRNAFVAAFGKAACGMSRAADDILHSHIVDGVVSMPVGTVELFRKNNLTHLLPRTDTRMRYYEGAANNLPDENAQHAALEIKTMIGKLTSGDLLLILISGGGSALLPLPVDGITLKEKTSLVKLLSQRGASIEELNTVRQNLSELKGGRLAKLAAGRANRVITLIISDVVGDPLEIIASGPTYPRVTRASAALDVIRKYQGTTDAEKEAIPKNIIDFLRSENERSKPFEQSQDCDNLYNLLIGTNRIALRASLEEAEKRQFQSEIVSCSMIGEAGHVGREYANRLNAFVSESNGPKRRCWLWGGETTVRVKGTGGRGGRNQEMVLAFALEAVKLKLAEKCVGKFSFLSAGTDGQDGPTDAAGAVIDSEVLKSLDETEIDFMNDCLARNDSYTFWSKFRHGVCHVKCGLTGTNVMDVQVMTLEFDLSNNYCD